MSESDRLRLAVFIDFDNIEIGVKNTLGASFDAGLVLEALKERGEVVSKMAYSDWQRAGGYSRALTQHAIRMVQRNLTPGGDKNGADINLALDALEMAFTHPHINAFVIVGGDSDFISLLEKLKQYDKKVFVVGGRQFTSVIMQRNCHEFIAYENLQGAGTATTSPAAGGRRHNGREARGERLAIDQAIPLVTRAMKVLSDREVSPQLGLLKSTLLQLDSTFSERSYGAGSFRDFAQKLEKVGVLKVYQAKGGWLIGPVEGTAAAPDGVGHDPVDGASSDAPVDTATESAERIGAAGTNADGLTEFRRVLTTAQIRRWPMYLRNVKQILRQAAPPFDEKAYGFGSLVDLLRAAHRDGIIRVDRDRQGVIRVFQGSPAAPARDAQEMSAETPAIAALEIEPSSASIDEIDSDQAFDDGHIPPEHVDTTAARLQADAPSHGRAPRRRRRPARESAASDRPSRSRRTKKDS